MPPPDPATDERLLRLAEAVADQNDVDWDEVEESIEDGDLTESVAKLRTLERLSGAFRSAAAETQPQAAAGLLFRWGSLDVRAKLGEGSFGEVYRAYDPALDREVALKLRRPVGPGSVAGAGRQFVREAQRLARLRHPNVVAIHGADMHDRKVGFWTDLIDGKTLREVVNDQGPMGAEEAVSIGLSVCRALAAVHAAGLVHGDVKPANVMREQGGRIVLMDFGTASMLHGPGGTGPALEFQGTPATLAPELLEGEAPTVASDIYSLGAFLYFLVCGAYPVQAESLEQLRRRHRDGDTVLLRDRRADLPGAFVEVVDRAITADPAERYPSAGAMEKALVHAMGGDVGIESAGRRRHRWVAAGVAIATLFGFALWTLRPQANAPSPTPSPSRSVQNVQVLSSGDGNQGQASFSPDGRMIAYVDDFDGVAQVWIRSVAGGKPLQITDAEEPASRPRWSGRDEIVFSRQGGIWAVPALGGEPRQIAASGVNPDVSVEGSLVVYEHDRWLWTVSADGGTPRRIESVPRRFFAEAWATPALSPDGTEVVYFMQEAGPLGDLWITALDGTQPRRLTFDRVEAGGPAWTPNGEGLVFWSRRHGTLNLWHLAIDSGEIRPLTTGVGEDSAPAVSPDGSRLAFSNTENRWILTGRDTATGTERELLDRRLPIWIPELSPDGRRLAFFQAVGPAYHLFTVDLDGSGLRQVTTRDEVWNIHPRWSWGGEHLYYYQERPQPEFRRVPASGGESELIARGWTWQTHMHAAPSPDDSQIAYVEQDADGGSTVIWNRQSDHRQTLPEPHIHAPQWSPDGTALIGFTHDGQVRRCTLDPLICERVTDGFRARLSTDGETIYFHRHLRGTRWQLWAVDADGSSERRLGVTGPHGRLDRTFAVTPEGEVIYTRYQPGESDLWTASLGAEESLD